MLNRKLEVLVSKIGDRTIREKVLDLLENPTFGINGKTYTGLPMEVAPAGRSHHHSYPGGYIEHVVSSANLASALCDSIEEVYHGKVDRDLVVAGILLHDLFKPITYAVNENGTYDSTRLADYLDHLSLAISELVRRDFPLDLVHIVAAHHGAYGPIRARTIEALVCHLADSMDSRLNGEILNAASYLARRAVGEELLRMNSKEAFQIVHSKSTKGWEGIAKAVERIRRQRRSRKT